MLMMLNHKISQSHRALLKNSINYHLELGRALCKGCI